MRPRLFVPLVRYTRASRPLQTSSRLSIHGMSRDLHSTSRAEGSGSQAGASRIPIIKTLEEMRAWRKAARDGGKEVGIVPTMGALHEGHLNLVRTSLARHALTVMTLFVNPMQFAPTEDLSKYPRTLARDLELLSTLLPPPSEPYSSSSSPPQQATAEAGPQAQSRMEAESPLVIFNPPEEVMYPLRGNLQDLSQKRGVEVDVKGWGDVMEGASRPQFFKGVATVCTKLFNAVEPDHAYFGQKDIQQALLLRIMLKDLLLSHPTPERMHIIPTSRDSCTNLALSSRNAYLSPAEMEVAPVLYQALSAAQEAFDSASTSASASGTETSSTLTGEDLVSIATSVILKRQGELPTSAANLGLSVEQGAVELKLDYIEVFDKDTFEPVRGPVEKGRELVIAGAVWVGKTRLIDNLLLGWDM